MYVRYRWMVVAVQWLPLYSLTIYISIGNKRKEQTIGACFVYTTYIDDRMFYVSDCIVDTDTHDVHLPLLRYLDTKVKG